MSSAPYNGAREKPVEYLLLCIPLVTILAVFKACYVAMVFYLLSCCHILSYAQVWTGRLSALISQYVWVSLGGALDVKDTFKYQFEYSVSNKSK